MLQLDDNFRIVTDSSLQNYILEKLSAVIDKKTREVVRSEWNVCGYHGNSMRSVLHQYLRESLITDYKLETLHNVLDRLNEIENIILKVVKQENFKLAAKQDD
jgi:RNA binding exosome subunit